MTTATRPAPDLNGKLAEAHAEAETIRGELSQAEADLAGALEVQDFKAADEAKARVESLRPHVALAEASERALRDALTALDTQRQTEQAAAQRQAREEAAQAAVAQAMAAEQEVQEAARRHLAEALAGIDAVRGSLAAAKAAEMAGADARQAANQARAELEGTVPLHRVMPNWASGRIERSSVLTAILHGREL
jgi:chromosome segregation ATPase